MEQFLLIQLFCNHQSGNTSKIPQYTEELWMLQNASEIPAGRKYTQDTEPTEKS